MTETLNLLSNLEKSEGGGTSLRYPTNLFEGSTDYIKFQFYKYKGPFGGNSGETGKIEAVKGGSVTNDFAKYNQAGAMYESYQGASNIMMYMPEDVNAEYGAQWNGKDFSNIGAEVLRGSGGALAGDVGNTANAIGSLIKNASGALPTAGAEAIANGINATGVGNVSTNDVLGSSLGVVLNPNTELLFSGFQMRSFSLKFRMAPRNKPEAETMRTIIGTFKKVALPTFGNPPGGMLDLVSHFQAGFKKDEVEDTPANAEPAAAAAPEAATKAQQDTLSGSNANYIGVPGLCQVKFMHKSGLHPYLPQYKVCAITNVSVNYTPDGVYATYTEAGAPVAVDLTIGFAETKLIYSDDINLSGATY
jgi:hypothetical protein